jgi:hypothetical protein
VESDISFYPHFTEINIIIDDIK